MKCNGFNLADKSFYEELGDEINNIEGIIGVDSLPLFNHVSLINYMKGKIARTCKGDIPFGPVKLFLTESQIDQIFGVDEQPLSAEPNFGDTTPLQNFSSSDLNEILEIDSLNINSNDNAMSAPLRPPKNRGRFRNYRRNKNKNNSY